MWTQDLKYLGMYICSNKIFKCDMHKPKIKFYRALNSILGKIGVKSQIDNILTLISTFAEPVLLFGLETGCLSNAQIDSLNYTFNSIYMKLFYTFDVNIINECRFYTNRLPLEHVIDNRFLRFCKLIKAIPNSPARLLFNWCGLGEYTNIQRKYEVHDYDSIAVINIKIWNNFVKQLNVI